MLSNSLKFCHLSKNSFPKKKSFRCVQIQSYCIWQSFVYLPNNKILELSKLRAFADDQLIFSSAVLGENPRYCYSLGVVVVLQKLSHFVILASLL